MPAIPSCQLFDVQSRFYSSARLDCRLNFYVVLVGQIAQPNQRSAAVTLPSIKQGTDALKADYIIGRYGQTDCYGVRQYALSMVERVQPRRFSELRYEAASAHICLHDNHGCAVIKWSLPRRVTATVLALACIMNIISGRFVSMCNSLIGIECSRDV